MNEPTANAPHCCPATRWDTEEAGCVFICDGRRRIIKTNSPPPKRKPNRNEEEEGGGSRWEGLLREHAAPACPPLPTAPHAYSGEEATGAALVGSVGVLVGCMYKFCAVGMKGGGGGEIKTKRRRRKKYNPPPPQKKKHKPTKAQTGEAVLGWAQGMPNCTTSSSFASTRICERALKA